MAAMIVALAGMPVAEVAESADGGLRLRWRDDYRAETAATPLSLSLPAAESECLDGDRVGNWLWGLLANDSRLIAHWVASGVAAAPTPLALLASPIGRDCAGAVSFHPPGESHLAAEAPGETSWLSAPELAALLFEVQLAEYVGFGWPDIAWFTLAGGHPKVAVVRCGDRWGIPAAGTPTTHILKLPSMKDEVRGRIEHGNLNEHLCLAAARNAGLDAARSSILVDEVGETALAVERFDRVTGPDGAVERHHQEHLCGALGYPPPRGYRDEGGPSAAQIAGVLRARGGESEVWRFADALAFAWLIAARGAHARKFAVLLDGPEAALAPLYGVSSSLPNHPAAEQHPHSDFDAKVWLAMGIGGDHRLSDITAASWRRAARQLGLDAARLLERVATLARRMPAAFEQAAQEVAVRAVAADFADRFCDVISRRTTRLGALLEGPLPRGGADGPNRAPPEATP